jgi:hypothetical protein
MFGLSGWDPWGFPSDDAVRVGRAVAKQNPGLAQRRPAELVAVDWTGLGISNISEPMVDEGLADLLQCEKKYTHHAAVNFNGEVWWEDGQFHEDVWVYGQIRGHHSSPTLEELAEEVCAKWGRE